MPEKETATPVASGAIAEAERIKALGNDAYKAGKHAEAVRLYSDAIEKNSSNAIYYANRTAALLGQKRYIIRSRKLLRSRLIPSLKIHRSCSGLRKGSSTVTELEPRLHVSVRL